MDRKGNTKQNLSHGHDNTEESANIICSKERRRTQNRVAQKAYRVRQAALAAAAGTAGLISTTENPPEGASPSQRQGQTVLRFRSKIRSVSQGNHASASIKSLDTTQQNCGRFNTTTLSPDHRLLGVIQNNVMRGLLSNMIPLQLTQSIVSQYDAVSIFSLIPGGWSTSQFQLPPTLEPTFLQTTISHHPWVDILPCPKLRDNILFAIQHLLLSEEQETELCEDMVGVGKLQADGHGPGLLLWGEGFCIESWEVSEAILTKWQGIFGECQVLLKASAMRRHGREYYSIMDAGELE